MQTLLGFMLGFILRKISLRTKLHDNCYVLVLCVLWFFLNCKYIYKSTSISFSRLYQVWLKQLSGSVNNYKNKDAVDIRRQLGKLSNILLSLFISLSHCYNLEVRIRKPYAHNNNIENTFHQHGRNRCFITLRKW